MNYKIIRSLVSLPDLVSLVNVEIAEGYTPEGAPFFDAPRGQWCQAVFKRHAPAGEISVREPKAGRR